LGDLDLDLDVGYWIFDIGYWILDAKGIGLELELGMEEEIKEKWVI
jgi:hypothetical protein